MPLVSWSWPAASSTPKLTGCLGRAGILTLGPAAGLEEPFIPQAAMVAVAPAPIKKSRRVTLCIVRLLSDWAHFPIFGTTLSRIRLFRDSLGTPSAARGRPARRGGLIPRGPRFAARTTPSSRILDQHEPAPWSRPARLLRIHRAEHRVPLGDRHQ